VRDLHKDVYVYTYIYTSKWIYLAPA
jgi:hypothetical protein